MTVFELKESKKTADSVQRLARLKGWPLACGTGGNRSRFGPAFETKISVIHRGDCSPEAAAKTRRKAGGFSGAEFQETCARGGGMVFLARDAGSLYRDTATIYDAYSKRFISSISPCRHRCISALVVVFDSGLPNLGPPL